MLTGRFLSHLQTPPHYYSVLPKLPLCFLSIFVLFSLSLTLSLSFFPLFFPLSNPFLHPLSLQGCGSMMFAFWSRCGPTCPTAHASTGANPLWNRLAWCTWEAARCRGCWMTRDASLRKVCSYLLLPAYTHTSVRHYILPPIRPPIPNHPHQPILQRGSHCCCHGDSHSETWPVQINIPLTWGRQQHLRALGPAPCFIYWIYIWPL